MSTEQQSVKMWSGRFREPLDKGFEAWQRSIVFDWRLLDQEVAASKAHASALHAAGILSESETTELRAALAAYGMRSAMSRKGDCWDNAPTESLWGSLKVARLHGVRLPPRRAAMDEVIDWMGFYNHRRLHSTLDYLSPMQFEQHWLAAQEKRAA